MSLSFEFISENRTTTTKRHEERSKALAHTARVVYRQRLLKIEPSFSSITRSQPPTHKPAAGWEAQRHHFHKKCHQSPRSKPTRPHDTQRTYLMPALDPYGAAGVNLTASSCEVICFLSKTWIDEHLLGYSPWVKPFLHPIILQKSIAYMQDEAFRPAEELPFLNIFRRVAGSNSFWHTRTLWCKARAIMAARSEGEQLEQRGTTDRMIKLMTQLFVGAVCGIQLEEARIHGEALQVLLFKKLEIDGESSVVPIMLSYILHHDVQLAQMTGRPTVFDVDFWEMTFAGEIGSSPVAKFLRLKREGVARRLDSSLRSATLIRLFTELWECLQLWQKRGQPSPDLNGPAIAYHVLLRYVFTSAALSNHHLECRQRMVQKCRGIDSPGDVAGAYIEVMLAASLLLYLATFAGNPRINGIEIWPKVHRLLVQLRQYLDGLRETFQLLGNRSDIEQWRRPMLYAYWIGATWEQSQSMSVPEIPLNRFTQGFVDLATEMGIANWDGVRHVVNGFSDSDYAKPHGRTWVDRALREGLG